MNFFPVEDDGTMVFCVEDPRTEYPDLVVNEFARPAEYPDGTKPVLGRKTDDPGIFQAFTDDRTCIRSGFDPIDFTVVPNWAHYRHLILSRKFHRSDFRIVIDNVSMASPPDFPVHGKCYIKHFATDGRVKYVAKAQTGCRLSDDPNESSRFKSPEEADRFLNRALEQRQFDDSID